MTKKVNWRVYERDHIYPQSLAAYYDLIRISPTSKYPYLANHYEVMSYIRDYFWWARDLGKIETVFRGWLKIWLEEPKTYRQFIEQFSKTHQAIKRTSSRLRNRTARSKKLTDRQSYSLYYQAKLLLLHNFFLSEYPVDLFDDFFNQIFTKKLIAASHNKINFTDLQQLLHPASPSAILLYQKRLLELSLKKKIPLDALNSITNQYCWIVMSWDGSNELTLSKVKSDLKKLKKKSVLKRRRELSNIRSFTTRIKVKRIKLIKKYKLLNKDIAPYLLFLDNFTVLHDWRKEAQMRSNQLIFQALKSIAKRFSVKYSDLIWYFNPEIRELCRQGKKVNKIDLNKRQAGLTWIVNKGKINEYLGTEAKKVLNKLVLSVQKAKQVSEIKGIPASQGQVKGKVYVVKSAKEALKVLKPGGVLVTSMTTVDYLPAMRKASAIVTDDGGLTCHAAIVSRELKVPCVVGTKIATQIFKNGDRIEVDAVKGKIKKI